MLKWLKDLFGGSAKGASPDPASPPVADKPEAGSSDEHPSAAETRRRMDAAWAGIGTSDSDLLSYLINPQFQGAPPWPNMRQAFRVLRTPDSLIIASDGLTDPAPSQTDADDFPGFGAEVYIELPGQQDLPQAEIMDHWAFALIESFARNVAGWGGINAMLNKHGVLSTELPVGKAPVEGWLGQNDSLGILVGIPVAGRDAEVEMPLGPVRLVPVTLLHPTELDFVATGGAEERAKLVEALAAAGIDHMSVAPRDSVI